MLEYDRTDLSEGIDVNKNTLTSKKNVIYVVIGIIAKLKIFNRINRTTFTDDIIPFERNDYTCIPAIDIDSVLKIDNKRAYPQAYLEQCKYKLKKRKQVNFIDDEIIDEDSENDSYEEISIKEELRL